LLIEEKLEGIGVFAWETLSRMARNHPEVEFYCLFDRQPGTCFLRHPNIIPIQAGPKTRHPLLWYFWMEQVVPGIIKKIKPDLFFSPDGFLSLRTRVPSLPVIHDLNFEYFPDHLPPAARRYYRRFFPRYALKGKRVITVSEYSRKTIMEKYGIREEQIDVVYNGSKENFRPATFSMKEETRRKYSGGKPYFLYVGSLHPRKNIPRMLLAYEKFRETTGIHIRFVIAGEKMGWAAEYESIAGKLKYREDLIFTGRVNDQTLNELYGAAFSLVYVPYFEGFGIPLIEAMNCETPIITGNVTSLPEVAGDAALYANPYSVDSITESMIRISSDENLRTLLIQKGKLRKEQFSWEKTAEKVWQSILKSCP
jgi:glycosyltransferase involved in cell wall biosynthesis